MGTKSKIFPPRAENGNKKYYDAKLAELEAKSKRGFEAVLESVTLFTQMQVFLFLHDILYLVQPSRYSGNFTCCFIIQFHNIQLLLHGKKLADVSINAGFDILSCIICLDLM